jgi:D-glycero-D-manno-heptose 1,7-bisphosphate phosphatase
MDTLNAMHSKMHRAVQAVGGRIDAVFYCPHSADTNCSCRKPRPGMFERISSCFNTSLSGVFAVGDSQRDLEAAVAAGAQPVLVLTGMGVATRAEEEIPEGTLIFTDLTAVAEHLLRS